MTKNFEHDGRIYHTRKHCVLEHIFFALTQDGQINIGQDIPFYHKDVISAYSRLDINRPTSSSNFVLDITRKDNGIEARVPDSLRRLGYDLRKKTGLNLEQPGESKNKYAGEFVYVGEGNAAASWLKWPEVVSDTRVIENHVPPRILPHLHNDEGALFSVIDYCDLLSYALFNHPGTVFRVQNPMKWQPNELDGLYYSYIDKQDIFYPVEAKALSTGDDINLDQMWGGHQTIKKKRPKAQNISLAIRMLKDGVVICVLRPGQIRLSPVRVLEEGLESERFIRIVLDKPVPKWARLRVDDRNEDVDNGHENK